MRKFAHNFRVIRNIYYRRKKWIHEISITYEFSLDCIDHNNFKIEVRKFTDGHRDNSVTYGIPLAITQEYTKVIFPALLEVKDKKVKFYNHLEIKDRLSQKKEELKQISKYLYKESSTSLNSVDEFYLINQSYDYFISLMSKDGTKLTQHFLGFDIMKFFIFCIKQPNNFEKYDFSLKLSLLDCISEWTIEKSVGQSTNIVKYFGNITNASALFENFIKIAEDENYRLDMIDREKQIKSEFIHEIQFVEDSLDFEFSEMKIKVNHDYYDYEETICISAINTKSN